MLNFLKRLFQKNNIKDTPVIDNLPIGCIYCRQFTGKGCAISGINFWTGMNVAVRPKDCPLIEKILL